MTGFVSFRLLFATNFCEMLEQNMDTSVRYFFDEGLRFECTCCGKCCGGSPGIIYVAPGEIECIARHLDISREKLIADYLAPCRDSYTIKERPDYDCMFLENNRCTIYKVRPNQCRTFPFWIRNLSTRDGWAKTCASCPGIGQGRRFTKEEILVIINDQ